MVRDCATFIVVTVHFTYKTLHLLNSSTAAWTAQLMYFTYCDDLSLSFQ